MKVAILAGSQSSSYDSGREDFIIEEVSDIEEANEIGAEMPNDWLGELFHHFHF